MTYSPSPQRAKHRLYLVKQSRPPVEGRGLSPSQGDSRQYRLQVLPSHPRVYQQQAQSHLLIVPRILPRQPQHVCHHTYQPITLTSPKPKRPLLKGVFPSVSNLPEESPPVLNTQHPQQTSRATGECPVRSRGEQAVLRRGRAVTDG